MKTTHPVLDSILETQNQFISNWIDSAKKMQSSFGAQQNGVEQDVYKQYFEKQMDILKNMQNSMTGIFNQHPNQEPTEMFRGWINQQATYAKQMADYAQSLQTNFMNFGKPAEEYTKNFNQANEAFTSMYNNWMNTLNSTYDTLSKNMNGSFNKDVFSNFMQGNQVIARMQEFFHPMAESMQNGKFNIEAFKNYFSPESYKNLTRAMFGNLYNDSSITEVYNNSLKQLHDIFATQNNLSREFFTQLQNLKERMPQLFGTQQTVALKDLYSQLQSVFGKTFEPLLKLVNPGKEKDQAEAIISMMDKLAEYHLRQAEMQTLLQNTARNAVETIAEKYAEKYGNPQNLTKMPDSQEMYNDWVKTNEELFTALFAGEDFGKVKAETLNLSLEIRQHFEKQFEQMFSNYPIVFKSEVEDLQKTIHDLKKQVKELRQQLNVQEHELHEEEKSQKKKK